jgi:nucleoside-diphosphate kinase
MTEKTLILLKPDAVSRGLIGRVTSRFEDAGLKISAMKFVQADEATALSHYTEDIAERRGQHVRDQLTRMITSGPVVAMVLEGIGAINVVRKLVGATQSSEAAPGTIRGDFSHVCFAFCDAEDKVLYNLVHASADESDAKNEIPVWFKDEEIVDWNRSDAFFTSK